MTKCMFVVRGCDVCVSIEADGPIASVTVNVLQGDVGDYQEFRLSRTENRFLGSTRFDAVTAVDRIDIIAIFCDGSDDSYSNSDFRQNRIIEA